MTATAQALYREFHARCFWHCPRDLVITSELVPLVIRGLRHHGGHAGWRHAAELERRRQTDLDS